MSDDLDNAREGSPNKGNSRQLAHSSAMSALNENVSDIFKLPAGVMQVIGLHLSTHDLPNARLTCQSWKGCITDGLTHYSEHLPTTRILHFQDSPRPSLFGETSSQLSWLNRTVPESALVTKKLKQLVIFPLARSKTCHLSPRMPSRHFQHYFSFHPDEKMQEVEVQCRWPIRGKPRIQDIESYQDPSLLLNNPFPVSKLDHLRTFKLIGYPFFPPETDIKSLLQHPCLESLELDTGYMRPVTLSEGYHPHGPYSGPDREGLRQLSSFGTRLKHLVLLVPAPPTVNSPTQKEAFASFLVACLSNLNQLESLRLPDLSSSTSPIPPNQGGGEGRQALSETLDPSHVRSLVSKLTQLKTLDISLGFSEEGLREASIHTLPHLSHLSLSLPTLTDPLDFKHYVSAPAHRDFFYPASLDGGFILKSLIVRSGLKLKTSHATISFVEAFRPTMTTTHLLLGGSSRSLKGGLESLELHLDRLVDPAQLAAIPNLQRLKLMINPNPSPSDLWDEEVEAPALLPLDLTDSSCRQGKLFQTVLKAFSRMGAHPMFLESSDVIYESLSLIGRAGPGAVIADLLIKGVNPDLVELMRETFELNRMSLDPPPLPNPAPSAPPAPAQELGGRVMTRRQSRVSGGENLASLLSPPSTSCPASKANNPSSSTAAAAASALDDTFPSLTVAAKRKRGGRGGAAAAAAAAADATDAAADPAAAAAATDADAAEPSTSIFSSHSYLPSHLKMRGLAAMTSSWSTSLAHLEIRNMALVSIGDVPDKVTRGLLETSLMSLTKLKTLVLEGKSQQGCIPLDLRALPDSIESLELKHFVLMDKGIEGRRAPEGRELMRTRPIFRSMRAFFPNLSKLSLSACSVVDGKTWDLTKVLSIASSSVRTERINEALDREAMEDFFRLGLPGLITLRDLNLHQLDALSDRHLVNFSSLTRLTSLSIHTLSNPKVNHSSLPIVIGAAPTLVGSLQGLPKMRHLQRLSWFVGDLLDELMPISCLSALPRLYTFSVPTNLYYRIQRWHRDVESCLPPYCELETV